MIVTVRAALEADAEAIAEVHVASSRWAYRGVLPDELLARMSLEERTHKWRATLAAGAPSRVVVAESGGRVVGFANYGPAREGNLPVTIGELYAVYVVESAAGQGVGRALLAAAIAGLRNRGCTAAVLWVLDKNARARRFYEREGWHADGATRVEIRPDHERLERRYITAL